MKERVSKKGGWKARAAFVAEGEVTVKQKRDVIGIGSTGQPPVSK
jgi:hypothetical protein